jgi:3-isopropylmalate dehydrogenase
MLDAARLIEQAVADGFADGGLRPMEFGGDMGLQDMTSTVLSYTQNASPE